MGTYRSVSPSIVSTSSVDHPGSSRAFSYCTGREGSCRLSHSYDAWKAGPLPASLPNDQMITEGKFLSRSQTRRTRSTCAWWKSARQASVLLPKPMPCDSMLASSMTYSPSSSHSSYQRSSQG